MKIEKSNCFKEAKVIKDNKLLDIILKFFIVFLVITLIEGIFQSVTIVISLIGKMNIAEIGSIFSDSSKLTELIYSNSTMLLISLFSTICSIIVSILYCVKIEKRPITSMLFRKKHFIKHYLIGLIVGFIMFTSVILIEVLTGTLKFDGINNITVSSIYLLILFFIGFAIQSASEEILVRGYLMTSIGSKYKVSYAIFISALTFGLMHISNDGFSLVALINITLIGIFFALYYICFDNIWGVSAIHCMWNYAQGNIYGIKVSGIQCNDFIFNTIQLSGYENINGGSFGAEGGLIATLVILVSILSLIIYMYKKGKISN